MAPRVLDPDVTELQAIVDQIASGRLSEAQGREMIERLWAKFSHEPFYVRMFREMFPSLSKRST